MELPGLYRHVVFALLFCLSPAVGLPDNPPNLHLAGHPSPYLAMHAADPVRWQPFGPAALEQARRESKLIFITSGYFACHWCHVMQRESFRDPQVAAVLNRFIPTVVDRELQPDVDAQLIAFVQRTSGIAGWPLNVLLTPEGDPLVGFTYLPRDRFLKVVEATSQFWEKEPDSLRKLAREVVQALRSATAAGLPAPQELARAFLAGAMDLADEMAGGFGGTAKFPHVPRLQALLALYQRDKNERVGDFLRLTLDQMAGLSLRDHLGGGFFRYTVDPTWQAPHFEKMLYDNALLASLYLQAAQVFNEPKYAEVGRETLDFILRELGTTEGGFASSLSAVDNRGVEGGYYLWNRETLKGLLTAEEFGAVDRLWHMDRPSPFEAGYLPLATGSVRDAAESGLIDSAYDKLQTARGSQGRSLPRDEKRIAGWNGLALEALSRGARLDGGEAYRSVGDRLQNYIRGRLWDGQRLWRAAGRQGRLDQPGTLEDYAYLAAGLWAWQEVSHEPDALLPKLIAEAWRRFRVEGGWRLSEASWVALPVTDGALEDGALPSPQAALLEVSLQWAAHTHDEALRARALRALEQSREQGGRDLFRFASLVMLLTEHLK